jgi:type IV pilus assembly protein PilM
MRQPVLRAVQAVEKAGLRPFRVDLGGLALLRVAGRVGLAPGVAEARVDIGAEVTTVVVQVNRAPRFIRMLAGEGGLKLSRALVERLKVTLPEAEELKRRPVVDPAARAVIDRVTDSTLTAVRSSLDYYLGNASDVAGLGRVVLSGGGSLLPGLVGRFGDALGIPVVLADPLAGLPVARRAKESAASLKPALAVAAGLGLAEVA